jgi:Lrp/AsnC family leucine-responsive transcriptional regulator
MDSELTLDAVDRRILAALQLQGRITYDELAAQVQLSASAVLRRVRRLEESGVIAGYAAIVPPGKLGLGLSAYVEVQLQLPQPGDGLAGQFRTAVQAWPEVTECVCLSTGMHYLLRVVVADMAHYGRFMVDTLLLHPGVRDCKTSFVLAQVKQQRAVPI